MLQRLLRSSSSLQASFGRPESLSRCLLNRQWQRAYSIQTDASSLAKLPNIDPSKLSITETTTPKELIPPEELVFGRTFTGKSHESREPHQHWPLKLIFPISQIICYRLNGLHLKDGLHHVSHLTKISVLTRRPVCFTMLSKRSRA